MAGGIMKLSCRGRVEDVLLEKTAAKIGDRRLPFQEIRRGGELEAVEIAGAVFPVRVAREGERVFVWCAGRVEEFRRVTGRATRSLEQSGDLVSPMPGRVRRTLVTSGEHVVRGQVVMILEAMKMEHAIRAPRDGIVSRVANREGDLVEAGVTLAEIT